MSVWRIWPDIISIMVFYNYWQHYFVQNAFAIDVLICVPGHYGSLHILMDHIISYFPYRKRNDQNLNKNKI